MTTTAEAAPWTPTYSSWRHGGWYVDNIRYPSGGVGCVSRNYPDRKWRIVCDEREGEHTYPNRDAAARAEKELVDAERATWPRCHAGHAHCLGYLKRDKAGNFYETCWNCGIEEWGDKPGHPFRDPAPVPVPG